MRNPSNQSPGDECFEAMTSVPYRLTLKSVAGRTKPRYWDNPGSNDLRWRGPQQAIEDLAVLHEWWAEWLPTFNWQWFANFSIGDRPMTSNGVRTHVRKYIRWVSRVAGLPAYCFCADEYGDRNGRLHVHALVGNVGSLMADCGHRAKDDQGRKCCGKHAWPLGWARVYQIDDKQPMRDLTYYVSKYITKANGEWDLIGFPDRQGWLPSLPGPPA